MPRRLTREEVIARLRNRFGDSLDYSKVDYKKNSVPICIICPIHGEQWVRPDVLFSSPKGCPICTKEQMGRNMRLSTDEIIRRFIDAHDGYFTYDRESIDKARSIEDHITAICPVHGPIDVQIESHMNGFGCRKCSGKEKKTTESYIAEATEIWGDLYDYSPLEYNGITNFVTFRCLKHGLVTTRAFDHLRGHGCKYCGNERKGLNSKPMSQTEFINRCMEVHKEYYSYENTIYNGALEDIEVVCPVHGKFTINAGYHQRGGACPKCTSVSRGEMMIRRWLDSNNVDYIPQYIIHPTLSLFGRNLFRIDFYLPKQNIAIEFNGQQHYEHIGWLHSEEKFAEQQDRDMRLREYCNQHKIKLIEIPYTELNNLNKILNKKIGRLK